MYNDLRDFNRYMRKAAREANRDLRQLYREYGDVVKPSHSSNFMQGFGQLGSIVGAFSGNELPESDKAVREGIRSTIGQFGPWGAAIAAASGVVDAVGDLTGTNLDTIDLNAAKRAGVKGGAVFNKVMNMLPGNSML